MLVKFAEVPWEALELVRFWDLAATKKLRSGQEPDWTAGALVGVTTSRIKTVARGRWYVLDVRRLRDTPAKVEDFLWATHVFDDELCGRRVAIRVEQEGGATGLIALDQLARHRFVGVAFKGQSPQGSKTERAKPVATAAELTNVDLVEAAWNEDLLEELELFPDGQHDDQVDALSGAFEHLRQQLQLLSAGAETVLQSNTWDERSPAPAWGAIT